MKNYARIDAGRVAEIIMGVAYTEDAPAFVPSLLDPDNPDGGMTEQPADWPTFKRGDEAPIETRFAPEIVAALVQIADGTNVKEGDSYSNGLFAPYVEPAPDAATILASNTAKRDGMLAYATAQIAPLQDAVDLDMATAAEIAALKAWKAYRVQLIRADLTQWPAVWPAVPA